MTVGAVVLPVSLGIASSASIFEGQEQICDVRADYALGVEDYSEAVRLHAEVLGEHPDSALAHYHLGYAEGMIGNGRAELRARTNLRLLADQVGFASGETAAVALPPAAAVKAIDDEREPTFPVFETRPSRQSRGK
jgi:hypothetical protein